MPKDQDLRFRRTNQMLCSAFTELLSQKKFEDITINELCEKAFIRRATFYTHFMDKYDFFAYFIRQNRDAFTRKCPVEGEARSIHSFSFYMFQELINYLSEHMSMVHNVMKSNAFPILLDILAEEIRNSYRTELQRYISGEMYSEDCTASGGVSDKGISIDIVSAYHAGGIIHLLRYWLTHADSIPDREIIRQYESLMDAIWS